MRNVAPYSARRLGTVHSGIAMQAVLDRITPQPLLGAAVFLAATLTVGLAWAAQRPMLVSPGSQVLLLFLIAAVIGSHWLPIRVGKTTQLYLSSVPLYLLCCLFSPPVAAVATGLGMLAREISVCRRCGNTAGDIAAQVGRWTLLSFAVSAVVSLFPASYILYGGALAAVLLWLGDVCTSPFVLAPITGEDPFTIVTKAAKTSYAGELMQYLIGLFTLASLRSGSEWIGVVYLPLIVLSLVLLYVYLRAADELS